MPWQQAIGLGDVVYIVCWSRPLQRTHSDSRHGKTLALVLLSCTEHDHKLPHRIVTQYTSYYIVVIDAMVIQLSCSKLYDEIPAG